MPVRGKPTGLLAFMPICMGMERGTAAKRIARLMREAGLVGASHRHGGPTTTRRNKDDRPAPDLVDRDFYAAGQVRRRRFVPVRRFPTGQLLKEGDDVGRGDRRQRDVALTKAKVEEVVGEEPAMADRAFAQATLRRR